MLCGEIVIVNSEICTEHTNATCEQNVQLMNAKPHTI